ncbi:MAG: hypothetical protein UX02_C0003G0066 [Candidatus Moranbacteria bacterium GW2011_GWC1_45_18]|nr:MAG: hypothetical protein UT79_C0004G0066 [Candidatus Moranbacteria bacterium GW2011_GWC2_40_12]KKT33678.1 MAG: hypothetical protein UW19_C0007G0069 [Candidatus Moranbacteria bacterium GW2011_GWF2_44_10]KKT99523.1 MAG: hypothetical protein UX02_C0003G0066 [Candidatus Moranbacteria bacterium GW2011_GWC1_45_18]OGI40572.1 MAG: hypothetical protein A2374_05920 [Candidatus Moranbacteria bacterium RIFOXYB1_FULL_44_23]HBB36866.1 hypothetical protein [Candidatus Moranbacteria bacterium]
MQAIIESGFLADLRDGNIARVDRDEFRQILGLMALTPKPDSLLKFIRIIAIPSTKKFIARDHFVANIKEGARAKISYLGDNFRQEFLDKIEKPAGKNSLRCHELLKPSVDGSIFAELGGEKKVASTLAQIYWLMEQQPNGEDGTMLNDGRWNIFYIPNTAGVLRAVCVFWSGGGWGVDAGSVEFPFRWDVGSQVFSRNS